MVRVVVVVAQVPVRAVRVSVIVARVPVEAARVGVGGERARGEDDAVAGYEASIPFCFWSVLVPPFVRAFDFLPSLRD